jgi:succinyl-CoA:acetate CoA-transferase
VSRIDYEFYRNKVMSAEEAVKHIKHGDSIGFSGFTGAGYPKEVPQVLADRIKAAHAAGEEFSIRVLDGRVHRPRTRRCLADTGGVSSACPTSPTRSCGR